jgi:spore coat protein CotF
MAQKLNRKEAVSLEELVYSNSMQLEALIRLMVKKGFVSKDELMEEYNQLLKEAEEKQGK